MTILILSNEHDAHVDFVTPELDRRGLEYQVLHTDRYLSDFDMQSRITSDNSAHRIGDIDPSRVQSIWYRRPNMPEVNIENPLFRSYVFDEMEGYTSYMLGSLEDKFWVSPPANIELARNKIKQLQYARDAGFQIPDTLITTNYDAFLRFYEQHKGNVIIKSIKGHWYDQMGGNDYLFFTSKLDPEKLPTPDSLSKAPCLFQGYVPKDHELRVTVMGNKVFSAALYSQEHDDSKIDWRLGNDVVEHKETKLSAENEERVIALTRRFNLQFGAYDFIMTPNNQLVFLELNPNGQWGWIQEKTGMPLRESLVDLLEKGPN